MLITAIAIASVLHAAGEDKPASCPAVVMPSNAAVQVLTRDGRDPDGTYLWHRTIGYGTPGTISNASRRGYPYGRADSVRRPGFNGTLWHGEVCIGGVEHYAMDMGTPGPEQYGAREHADALATVRVGPYAVTVNPWEEIRATGKVASKAVLAKMEDSRNQWLKDHGFLGGVRSFMNDATVLGIKTSEAALDLTPKAIIPLPDDLPRLKPRMDVRGAPASPELLASGSFRVSLPPSLAHRGAPSVLVSTKK